MLSSALTVEKILQSCQQPLSTFQKQETHLYTYTPKFLKRQHNAVRGNGVERSCVCRSSPPNFWAYPATADPTVTLGISIITEASVGKKHHPSHTHTTCKHPHPLLRQGCLQGHHPFPTSLGPTGLLTAGWRGFLHQCPGSRAGCQQSSRAQTSGWSLCPEWNPRLPVPPSLCPPHCRIGRDGGESPDVSSSSLVALPACGFPKGQWRKPNAELSATALSFCSKKPILLANFRSLWAS